MKKFDVESFIKNGYLCLKNVFNHKEIQAMKNCCDIIEKLASQTKTPALINGTHFVVEGDRIDRAVWAGACAPYLLEIGADTRILNPVSTLLNSKEMDHLINQIHFKRPGDNVDFTWHQDSEHRRYGTNLWRDLNKKGSYIQTVLAIDPMTDTNGPLVIIKESSNQGHLALNQNSENLSHIDEKKALSINMEPGDLLLFGPYLIHGSSANVSDGPRRVLINGYSYPGANSRIYPGTGSGRKLSV